VYAYGGNPDAAALAGINTRWTILKTYVLMGVLCAISAAIAAARLNGATLDVGESYELYVIAAAVVGGTSFAGGIGTIPGAVLGVSLDLCPGEVVGLVGGNGAGKSTLMKVLSGAQRADSGEIRVNGKAVSISNPRDAKQLGIETIYQTLALADNLDAPGNVFLGRELTGGATLNDAAMESATRKVIGRLNPNFKNFKSPVLRLSGGQRQAVAIARA